MGDPTGEAMCRLRESDQMIIVAKFVLGLSDRETVSRVPRAGWRHPHGPRHHDPARRIRIAQDRWDEVRGGAALDASSHQSSFHVRLVCQMLGCDPCQDRYCQAPRCDEILPHRAATGRHRRYCTDACRQAAHRARRTSG